MPVQAEFVGFEVVMVCSFNLFLMYGDSRARSDFFALQRHFASRLVLVGAGRDVRDVIRTV
jgi:hypothetical protein